MVSSSSSRAVSVSVGSDSAIRHESLWFDDGSIVLRVEQSLFRVHRSILRKQSEIFADMFRLPQPNGEMTTEGCAVVFLPDRAADVTDLLQSFYEPLYFDRLSPDADVAAAIEFVSGILRLSTKYYIQPLRKKCIDILRRKIPTSLTDMDTIFGSNRDKYPEFSNETRLSIIPLALESNIPEFLPFGFYLCACLPTNIVRDTTVLTWKDKAVCLAGRDELLQAQRNITYEPMIKMQASRECEYHPSCSALKIPQTIREASFQHVLCQIRTLDIAKSDALALYICAPCVENTMSRHQRGRKQVWDMLPGIFQLGSWEDVRKAQDS